MIGQRREKARSGAKGNRTVTAARFRAECLTLIDEVARTGLSVTITRRGRPVAQLVPAEPRRRKLLGFRKGSMEIVADIMAPLDVEWEALR